MVICDTYLMSPKGDHRRRELVRQKRGGIMSVGGCKERNGFCRSKSGVKRMHL